MVRGPLTANWRSRTRRPGARAARPRRRPLARSGFRAAAVQIAATAGVSVRIASHGQLVNPGPAAGETGTTAAAVRAMAPRVARARAMDRGREGVASSAQAGARSAGRGFAAAGRWGGGGPGFAHAAPPVAASAGWGRALPARALAGPASAFAARVGSA